jgi:hypothetical protein
MCYLCQLICISRIFSRSSIGYNVYITSKFWWYHNLRLVRIRHLENWCYQRVFRNIKALQQCFEYCHIQIRVLGENSEVLLASFCVNFLEEYLHFKYIHGKTAIRNFVSVIEFHGFLFKIYSVYDFRRKKNLICKETDQWIIVIFNFIRIWS